MTANIHSEIKIHYHVICFEYSGEVFSKEFNCCFITLPSGLVNMFHCPCLSSCIKFPPRSDWKSNTFPTRVYHFLLIVMENKLYMAMYFLADIFFLFFFSLFSVFSVIDVHIRSRIFRKYGDFPTQGHIFNDCSYHSFYCVCMMISSHWKLN